MALEDLAARVVSVTAYRPRLPGTPCYRRFQTRTRAALRAAHQASAQDARCNRRFRILTPAAPTAERRALLRIIHSLSELAFGKAVIERAEMEER
jgi:hypothetical protein